MHRPLPGLLALFSLILVLSGCASWQQQLQEPTISLVGVDIRELGLLRQRYVLTLNVQNPNSISLPVRGMSYGVDIAGEQFATGVSPKAFTVPSYGDADIEVEMTTNLISSLRQVQELLAGKQEVVDYRLKGKLEVDMPFVKTIPFSNKGEFRLVN